MGGPNTELSLVLHRAGGGVFADIWSCNAYSMGGVLLNQSHGCVLLKPLVPLWTVAAVSST
jgi:hypothetical protein